MPMSRWHVNEAQEALTLGYVPLLLPLGPDFVFMRFALLLVCAHFCVHA